MTLGKKFTSLGLCVRFIKMCVLLESDERGSDGGSSSLEVGET